MKLRRINHFQDQVIDEKSRILYGIIKRLVYEDGAVTKIRYNFTCDKCSNSSMVYTNKFQAIRELRKHFNNCFKEVKVGKKETQCPINTSS